MPNPLIFEHPLNERCRTLLRLEHLFRSFEHFSRGTSVWDTRAAVSTLVDLAGLLSRSDLKGELMKELERFQQVLRPMADMPGVDTEKLSRVLDLLHEATEHLHASSRQLGQGLREDEFFKSIMQRSHIPAGTCEFDLPLYHHWLAGDPGARQQQLQTWQAELGDLETAVRLSIRLIRGSGTPERVVAEHGFLQRALSANQHSQLIRVTVPGDASITPELSGDKHRFTLRFRDAATPDEMRQVTEDVGIVLTLCAL